MKHLPDRNTFLMLAAFFEGGMVVVALGVGWLVGVPPLESLVWSWAAVGWGVAGVVPLYVGFVFCNRARGGRLRDLKDFVVETIGPSFSVCSKLDLAVIALLAGLGEEILFRGLLLPWTGCGSFVLGLVVSSLLFGLAHAATPMYVVLVATAGVFFGLQMHYAESLLAPIVTHAVYDYLAFLIVVKEYRLRVGVAQED